MKISRCSGVIRCCENVCADPWTWCWICSGCGATAPRSRGGQDFAKAHWLEPLNHSHLRLTRILLFLRHAGLPAEAQGLRVCLEDIAAHEGREAITPRTLAFWRAAV